MRGMRLHKREVKDTKELGDIIERSDVVRVGCVDDEGMFIVPLNYGYEYENGVLKLYIHSAKAGRKADAFGKKAQVAVEIDREIGLIKGDYTCNYSMEYESIMGNGVITLLEDTDEKKRGLSLIMKHLDPAADLVLQDKMLEAVHVYCIRVEPFTGKKREKQ